MTPRPYQSECVAAIQEAFKAFVRVLVVLPTGAGKTIIFSFIAQLWAARGERVLILAHREELIDQAIAKLKAATGIVAEKEKAEFNASLSAQVVVASVQTMIRRLDKWPRDHFSLVICDEGHHSLSDSWQSVLRHFNAQVLGVTATPDRGDKRNLGQFFETVAYEVSLFDLIERGYLSRITLKSIPLRIDLSKVRSSAGDYDAADLGSALEPYLDEIAVAIREQAAFRRTLAFLPLIATSQKFVAACRAAGLAAEHVDGESPDRKELLAGFARWDFDVLSNAMLLTEGYDDPGIDCIVNLRPTRSRPLYAQICGRGTRLAPGKENLLLLDFLWAHQRHALIRPAHLIAKDDFEADQITELAELSGKALPGDVAAELPLDLRELATEAQSQREEALRKKLKEHENKAAKVLSAEEFALRHNSMDAAEYVETMAWEKLPATEKQLKYLRRAKIDLTTVRGKGHASKLLGLYFDKKQPVLASAAQQALLRRMGHPNPEAATDGEFRRFMGARSPKQNEMVF